VFCQLEVLRHCFPPSVRHILEELPESLDETYEHILREIRKANQGHAHRLLQCLVVAVRPLRIEELAEVLAFDFKPEGIPKLNPSWRWEDQEEAVISACSSLVIVVKDGDSRMVQFSHFSVKEFLTSSRLAESSRDVSRYHVHLEPAHAILSQACLGVLLRLDDLVDRDDIKNFPLARYAAEHWDSHAQFGNVSSCIKDGMECLFDVDKPHFSTWLWIYDKDSGRSMSTMCPEKPSAVPLYYAALLGFRDLAEQLLDKHPEHVYAEGGRNRTPLHASASAGHTGVFSLLIEHFPDVDIRDEYGQTPLHHASCRGHLEIGQQLLDRHADVQAQDEDGWTPLYGVALIGKLEFARMLLERGAAINALRYDGATPMHVASRRGHVEVVRLLLEHGADPNVRDKGGYTPAKDASTTGQQEILRLLTEYGAKFVM
jgi:ankyrin repeat protein